MREQKTQENWNFTISPSATNKTHHHPTQSPTFWSSPLSTFIKLNFDGASQGNPAPAGGEGVFHNDSGEILCLYALNLGHNTNNGAELTALVEGLKITIHNGYQKLIVEGDTSIIITICKKIRNGSLPRKAYHSRRLSTMAETLPILL